MTGEGLPPGRQRRPSQPPPRRPPGPGAAGRPGGLTLTGEIALALGVSALLLLAGCTVVAPPSRPAGGQAAQARGPAATPEYSAALLN